ncbi:Trimeric LpxA-like protein [Pseudocohnilembus persalinus]|uniref:Trimeric LpxA-like protein n=1 Tax=Pseudocohnilembus persalinus TaxID=266149 RepID=A0A0V0R7U8_PSEPJ|nr:Trimeric LpxA-like protein [Pseudocohnilembus persalinus]|eukprot:KRX10550.1 Trimeric LpxA-like protein [Pseudocohnilembus persalinus]
MFQAGKNSKIVNCVIWDNTEIGENCNIQNCLIGQNCRILNGAEIQRGVVIGEGSIIKENAKIQECWKICTQEILSEFQDEDDIESMKEVLNEDKQNLGENTFKCTIFG